MHTMTVKVEDSVLHKFQQFIKTTFPQNKVQIINDVVESNDEQQEVVAMANASACSVDDWAVKSEDDVWK